MPGTLTELFSAVPKSIPESLHFKTQLNIAEDPQLEPAGNLDRGSVAHTRSAFSTHS